MSSQWQSSTSGIKNKAAPVPFGFAVPASYSATDTSVPGNPILVDPFTVQYKLQPPWIIPDNCSCALTSASFAYTQPNIVGAAVLESFPTGNNRLTINYGGAGDVDIILDEGLYTYLDVQSALNIWFRTHDDTGAAAPPATPIVAGATDLVILTGITSTQKIIFSLNPAALTGGVFPVGDLEVSFVNPSPVTGDNDSIGEVLGYPTSGSGSSFTAPAGSTDIYSSYAPNVSDFAPSSSYNLYMSLVTNSYQNGATGQLLHSFPLGNVQPNAVAAYQPTLRYPVQLSSGTYSSLSLWTTDSSGGRLPWSKYQAPFAFNAVISKNKEDGSI